jgi:hypothetical protein
MVAPRPRVWLSTVYEEVRKDVDRALADGEADARRADFG